MSKRLNRYTCQTCKGEIVTVDRDEGVTPFMLMCRATSGCKGHMYSSMYHGVTGEPTYEWRKATPEEFAKASLAMKEHFSMGGLDIHPIQGASHVH